MAWIHNAGNQSVSFSFETDIDGKGNWKSLRAVEAGAGQSVAVTFNANETGEWIRVKSSRATTATVNFNYSDASRFQPTADKMFTGLANIRSSNYSGGLMYGLGDNRRAMGLLAGQFSNGKFTENGYYELDSAMNLVKKEDPKTAQFIRDKFAIPKDVISVDEASVLIIDDSAADGDCPKAMKHSPAKPTVLRSEFAGSSHRARFIERPRDILRTPRRKCRWFC